MQHALFLAQAANERASLPLIWWLGPIGAVLALGYAWYFYTQVMKESEGSPKMIEIAQAVREGAMAYLKRQYRAVGMVFGGLFVIFVILALLDLQNPIVPVAFLTGGLFSGLCGFFGMKTATNASARAANAARGSLNGGLQIALRAGAVMGLVVVGFALLDITVWFLVLYFIPPAAFIREAINPLPQITATMLSFGMGASTQALFARVGGGIYTKAADVGADLVGKVEAGIPEDDPRNPATIADNVGDNVGDVAGMGADLFESYVGSIIGTMVLGTAFFGLSEFSDLEFGSLSPILLPLFLAAAGIIVSILGTFFVRVKEGGNPQTALNIGEFGAAGGMLVISYFLITGLLPETWTVGGFEYTSMGVFWATIVGLSVGLGVGKITEYYTGTGTKPVISIVIPKPFKPSGTLEYRILVRMAAIATIAKNQPIPEPKPKTVDSIKV